ncbi:hypothetical protein F5884DRAFT_663008 [Xylogone sp. PMI_703]|nr:hypothetical protein F5884DRAFT_663008 [Xylogone sp. PMI_703]
MGSSFHSAFRGRTIAAVIVSIVLFSALVFNRQPITSHVRSWGATGPLGGHQHTCPQIYDTSVTFQKYNNYQSLDPADDKYWEDLLTPNGGFVIVEEPHIIESHHGTTDDIAFASRVRGISMFHQLHCLQMIRSALQESSGGKHQGHSEAGSLRPAHWLHCFDYLRQSILCLADDTLETVHVGSNGDLLIDGMVQHQCRDPNKLYEKSLAATMVHTSAHDHHSR